MPYVKNPEGKVCLALEPEVEGLLAADWALLDEAEEAEHLRLLESDQELTSHESQEEARVNAGLYDVPNLPAAPDAEGDRTATEKANAAAEEAVTPPAEPAVPSTPEVPETPAAPSEPETPADPGTPDAPAEPSAPTNPDGSTPSEPSAPETPSEPQTPANDTTVDPGTPDNTTSQPSSDGDSASTPAPAN